jgi:hypothetical protein
MLQSQFSPILGEKELAFFIKKHVMIQNFQQLALFLTKNANFLRQNFWQK